MLRTSAPGQATAALEGAGATVCASDGTSPAALTVSGLTAEKVVTVLSTAGVQFSEVSAQRVSLEKAYLDLTRDAVEYRASTQKAR